MKDKTIYSVVDLEATGTSAARGDRIIQFSCTFVQDQRIIDNFSTLVNPLMPIPERITRLTGITDQMVSSAPTFQDVARLLSNMLRGTVFVAHNVNFDFPFMNSELRRLNLPTLNIKAIDTVTMSQILLPTLPSYQLRRISSYFNIVHKHPHSASSDASATADLLILLIKRLLRLPYQTLKTILKIRPQLPRNTLEMFIKAFRYRKRHHRSLPPYLRVKRGIVLRRLRSRRFFRRDRSFYRYPVAKADKLRLYQHQLCWLPQQARMMNQIYKNFTKDKSKRLNCLFEVSTGMGRKIGYALPLAYLSHNQRQTVIISTDSSLLREQLREQTIPTLNNLLPFSVSSLEIKDGRNYLDLNRFVNTLKVRDKSDLSQLLKAKLLVWLTMTETGDLEELHLDGRIPYLREVRHYRNRVNRRHNPFYREDPVKRQSVRASCVNFVIVSHTYLYQHARELSKISRRPYLVIDEATSLPDRVLGCYRFKINLNQVNLVVRKIFNDLDSTHRQNLRMILPPRPKIRKRLKKLNVTLQDLKQQYRGVCRQFSGTFLRPSLLKAVEHQFVNQVTPFSIKRFFNSQNASSQVLNRDVHIVNKITNYFLRLGHRRSYCNLNHLELDDFYRHVRILNEILTQFNALVHQVNSNPENGAFEIITNRPYNVTQCTLKGGLVRLRNQLRQNLYYYFRPAIFTDHAFIMENKFLSYQFELPSRRFLIGTNLNHHYLIINVYQSQKLRKRLPYFVAWLAALLIKQERQTPCRILIAFTSCQLMQAVFDQLTSDPHLHCSVYAEGINGNPNQILKRLINTSSAIVMASNSWFIHLNLVYAESFDNLMIADLPFLTNEYLQNRSVQAKVLPVLLLIKRAVNYSLQYHYRLTVLDGRFLESNYYQIIVNQLPSNVMINQRKV